MNSRQAEERAQLKREVYHAIATKIFARRCHHSRSQATSPTAPTATYVADILESMFYHLMLRRLPRATVQRLQMRWFPARSA